MYEKTNGSFVMDFLTTSWGAMNWVFYPEENGADTSAVKGLANYKITPLM
jgi:hypothetical protein